ncbi:MAG: aryl-sulfate sulfotransferase [Bradymonadaceae bacterium]
MSTEKRCVRGYKEADGESKVVGDVVLEFDRSGEVVDSWSMFDVLEPYRRRRGEGATDGYWDGEYGERVCDWTHGNAVIPGDTPGTLVASLRHQDWIVKWNRRTGELIWRLGPEGDFEFPPGTDGEWFFHQHAPTWTEEGHLLVYDNGNNRPQFGAKTVPTTRIAEYRLDASTLDRTSGAKGTVREVWCEEYPAAFYAPYVGDLAVLPNDHVLVGDGGLLERPEVCVDEAVHGSAIRLQDNQKWARLREFPRGRPEDEVLEVWIRDGSRDSPRSYTMQGSRHLASL